MKLPMTWMTCALCIDIKVGKVSGRYFLVQLIAKLVQLNFKTDSPYVVKNETGKWG